MRVAKVILEAPVTSFRQPHFLIGRQLSFDMPPPSTIYGHIASALGELPTLESFRFGYHFKFESKGSDLEHQHIITTAGPKTKFTQEGVEFPSSVSGKIQPHSRDFLLRPSLTLYIDNPDLHVAFRAPAYCVVLGRSQDLACVVSSEVIELRQEKRAYLENTLLPFSMRQLVAVGTTSLMPQYIAPPPERQARFERYIVLRDRVFAGQLDTPGSVAPSYRFLQHGEGPDWWVDPSTPAWMGANRAVIFHGFK